MRRLVCRKVALSALPNPFVGACMDASDVNRGLRNLEGSCSNVNGDLGDRQESLGHCRVGRRMSRVELLYDTLARDGADFAVCFEPMLPKVYEIMLPSLDAKLNFVNVGQRHAAFLRHGYGPCANCAHADILKRKNVLLTAILSKLLDINGILEQKDDRA